MNPVQELKSILSKLESLTGLSQAGGAQTTAQYPPLDDFDKLAKEFKESSASVTESNLKDLTEIAVKGFEYMRTVLRLSYDLKKPDADGIKKIQKFFSDNQTKITKFLTNQTVQPHCKSMIDALNSMYWVLSDTPKMVFESSIESAEYNGLKVLQQKVPENTKWYQTFMKTIKALFEYQKQNFPMGLNWNVKGTKTVDDVLAALKGEAPKPPTGGVAPPPPPPPAAFVPQAPAAAQGPPIDKSKLFDELNQGEDITKRLKKVDKEALRREKEKPVEVQQKKQPQQQQNTQQKQESKPPKKYTDEKNWYLENYTNESLVEFKDDEVSIKQSLFIENCNNCGILIKHKVKSIFLQKSNKIQLVFDNVVSGVELVGCKRVEVVCLNQCPSFMVDNSEQVHLTFQGSQECSILSSKTLDFNITYIQADGELAKDTMVPEQFVTVWNKDTNRFETAPHEHHFG